VVTNRLTRTFAGEYTTSYGWRIYKSVDDNRWHIVNPETGNDFDSADTLAEMRDRYGNKP
jgi:hypothetical protein